MTGVWLLFRRKNTLSAVQDACFDFWVFFKLSSGSWIVANVGTRFCFQVVRKTVKNSCLWLSQTLFTKMINSWKWISFFAWRVVLPFSVFNKHCFSIYLLLVNTVDIQVFTFLVSLTPEQQEQLPTISSPKAYNSFFRLFHRLNINKWSFCYLFLLLFVFLFLKPSTFQTVGRQSKQ